MKFFKNKKISDKKYYIENREVIKEKIKIYSEKNKELIKEKLKIKIKCDCGLILLKANMSRHLKTKIHQ